MVCNVKHSFHPKKEFHVDATLVNSLHGTSVAWTLLTAQRCEHTSKVMFVL